MLPLEVNACVASPPDSSTKSTQTLESQSPAGPPLGTVQTPCASTDVLLLEMWHMGASAVETGTETSVFFRATLGKAKLYSTPKAQPAQL